jgi:hypothetical protein
MSAIAAFVVACEINRRSNLLIDALSELKNVIHNHPDDPIAIQNAFDEIHVLACQTRQQAAMLINKHVDDSKINK